MAKPLPRLIFILPLGLLAGLVLGWLVLQWAMRGPLAGQTHHDFGDVAIPVEGPAILTHTFQLTNRTRAPLTIFAARPDCGCLTTNAAFPITIAPHERIDLPITMQYLGSDPRGKTVHIRLDLGETGGQSLWVKAKPKK